MSPHCGSSPPQELLPREGGARTGSPYGIRTSRLLHGSQAVIQPQPPALTAPGMGRSHSPSSLSGGESGGAEEALGEPSARSQARLPPAWHQSPGTRRSKGAESCLQRRCSPAGLEHKGKAARSRKGLAGIPSQGLLPGLGQAQGTGRRSGSWKGFASASGCLGSGTGRGSSDPGEGKRPDRNPQNPF